MGVCFRKQLKPRVFGPKEGGQSKTQAFQQEVDTQEFQEYDRGRNRINTIVC